MRGIFVLVLFSFANIIHGQPLRLHPKNSHVFEYKGEGILLIGSGEHYGAVSNLDFNFVEYLQTLAKDGLNNVRIFTGGHKERRNDFGIERNTLAPYGEKFICAWKRSNVSGYLEGGNKFNLDEWDEDYFIRLKSFLKEAEKHKIIVEITLFSAFYGVMWDTSPLNSRNNINHTDEIEYLKVNTLTNGSFLKIQESYVRKMVRELNEFDNLYFEIQNEPWADNGLFAGSWNDYIQRDLLKDPGNYWRNSVEPANEASLDWQKKIAEIICDEESKLSKKHLISQNYVNFKLSLPEVDKNINIINFHYAHPEAALLNHHWQKPIGCNETGFSGKEDAPYRRQAWRFIMSGGSLFNHLDYSFTVGHEKGVDTTNVAPGGGSHALRKQFGFLRKFLEEGRIEHFLPDKNVVLFAKGANTYSLSNKASTQWLIYAECFQGFDLALRLPKGNYTARSFSTVTGLTAEAYTFVSNGTATTIRFEKSFSDLIIRIVKK